jgi:multidrug efflux system membrane fusion protein
VYLIKDDETAVIQPVKVARIQDSIAVISDGLQAAQRVVLDGQYKLKPGSHVVENKASKAADAKGTTK